MLNRKTKLESKLAADVAHGMKAWAIENGATHFCHWFQPLSGNTAEKHDGFLELEEGNWGQTTPIDHFSGNELLQSEPDASSFPHGGIRTTFEVKALQLFDISLYESQLTLSFFLSTQGKGIHCMGSFKSCLSDDRRIHSNPLHSLPFRLLPRYGSGQENSSASINGCP